jgi:adenine deaminase
MAATILKHLVADVVAGTVSPCEVVVRDGRIASVVPFTGPVDPGVLVPGFIDAHVHVESSMLPPWEFARVAMRHGTVASVSDPHEIANVLGEAGVRFMLDDAAGSPFTCWFGCPSCVPATAFETAGATLDAAACERLLDDPRIGSLSEMMNWPGAIAGDPQVLAKIAAAKARGKRVDGHAPGLRGEQARAYFARGIETDHECFTLDEAREKAALGVRILIREGSAARNLEALWPLLAERPALCMFCTDDARRPRRPARGARRGQGHRPDGCAAGRDAEPGAALRAAVRTAPARRSRGHGAGGGPAFGSTAAHVDRRPRRGRVRAHVGGPACLRDPERVPCRDAFGAGCPGPRPV